MIDFRFSIVGLAAVLIAGCSTYEPPPPAAPVETVPEPAPAPAETRVEPAPPAEPAPAVEPAPAAPRTYTVKKGDTLWTIAKKEYGKGTDWPRITEANPGLTEKSLAAGKTILLPAVATASSRPSASSAGQTVSKRGWTRGAWYNFYNLPAKRAEAEPKVREHIALFARTGVNMIYVLVKTPDGYAHFDSKLCPKRPGQDWDPLAFTIAECRKAGIEVHPYLNVFCDGKDVKGKDLKAYINRFPEHVEVSDNGKSTHWLSPGIPEVRAYERDVLMEVVRNYDIAGIHLDRIRYGSRGDPEEGAGGIPGYNPIAVGRYRTETKRKPDESDPRWLKWRQDQVTAFVRETRDAVKAAKPGLEYSASVFPDVGTCPKNQHQDWPLWVREGLIDSACPMNYSTDDANFERRLRGELAATRGKAPLLVGLGTYMKGMTPEKTAAQIRLCKKLGAEGAVLFNGYSLEKPAMAEAVRGAW